MKKVKQMQNEVAETKKQELATTGKSWGAAENIEVEDLQIPKILLMHPISEMVVDGKATIGEFRDNVEGKLLGSSEKPLKLIVFDFFKTWVCSQRLPAKRQGEKGKLQFDHIEPLTAENKNSPFEEPLSNGNTLVRVRTSNYYCLIPGDDLAGALPYVISFSRSAAPAAKKLGLFFTRLDRLGQSSTDIVVTVTSDTVKTDDGNYCVPDVQRDRDSTDEERRIARYWYDAIRSSAVKVVVAEGEAAPVEVASGAPEFI